MKRHTDIRVPLRVGERRRLFKKDDKIRQITYTYGKIGHINS